MNPTKELLLEHGFYPRHGFEDINFFFPTETINSDLTLLYNLTDGTIVLFGEDGIDRVWLRRKNHTMEELLQLCNLCGIVKS